MGQRCRGKGALFVIILLGIFLPVFLASCNGGGDGGSSPSTVAEFSGTPTTGPAPLTVTFTDNSTGAPTSWSWDFGDGGTSAAPNPLHTYAAAGTYDVTLTIDGPAGTDNVTKVAYITVTAPAPVAQFSGTPLSGAAPLTVDFTDLSTGGPTTWSWDFGDFSPLSSLQNPSHTYAEGTYTVELTVTGPTGSDTETKLNYIIVGPVPPAPVAGFSGTPTTGAATLPVQFTNQTTGVVDTLSWDFGDGSPAGTASNPLHPYATSGIYTVSLTATGPGGSDTFTETDYISVTPLAAFSADNTAGTAPLGVQFTDMSTGGATSWLWDFGDGSPTSTSQNPTHTYTVPGMIYDVSLTATGPGGDNTIIKPNYIATAAIPAPVADFSGAPTSGGAPLTVQFTDNSTGDISTYSWDFGDNTTSTLQSPSHDYDVSSGTYDVTLTVTGPGGSDNVTKAGYITAFSTMYTDDFARADNTTLGDHWTTPSGCSVLQVVLEHAQATDNNVINCAYWSWNPFAADQYSQVVGTFVNRGPAVRIQTGAVLPNFYFARATDVNTLQIRKMVDGTPTTLATIPVAPALTANSVVALSIVGNTLEVSVDGTPIDSVTDTTDPFTSGVPGIFINVTGINLDDWEGGSL